MRTIIINSANYVAGSQNQFAIKFPSNGVKFNSGDKIAVAGFIPHLILQQREVIIRLR